MKRNRLGIIGKPLGHSLSPMLHMKGMEKLKEGYAYEKWELKERELKEFLVSVKTEDSDILGFNVTIPYKEKIISYLDRLEENCKLLKAVNTVKYEAGKLVGYNTDGPGLLESLKKHEFKIKDKRILIIGSGGAARGIAIFLSQHKLKLIDITAINEEKGLKLTEEIGKYVTSSYFKLEKINEIEISRYDLIIQTTSLGMKNSKGKLDFPYEKLNQNQTVIDIVYNPIVTEFLKNSRDKVKEAIGGLEMLVYQGYHSFKIWTDEEEDSEGMLAIGRKILEEKIEQHSFSRFYGRG